MDIKKVKSLIDILEDSVVTEIEISSGDETIRISCNQMAIPQVQVPTQVVVPELPVTPEPATKTVTGKQVKSPMVGTFYSASSPDANDYVKIGDMVKAGDTLCIVEAMKIMNTIESDVSGTIQEVLLKSGDAVEFDQVLFVVN